VAHLTEQARLERRASRVLGRGEAALRPSVGESVTCDPAQLAPLAVAAEHRPGTQREPFDPVRTHEIGQTAHTDATRLQSRQGASAGDLLHLLPDPLAVAL